jgi:hypothetical protein
LWVLLDENRWLAQEIGAGTYRQTYGDRVDNSIYRSIIDDLLMLLDQDENKTAPGGQDTRGTG